MRYIIEYKDSEKKWYALCPEILSSDFGVEYIGYITERDTYLERLLDMVYQHRASYANWDASLFVNGQEVLYLDIQEGRKKIRLVDGSYIQVPQTYVDMCSDNICMPTGKS